MPNSLNDLCVRPGARFRLANYETDGSAWSPGGKKKTSEAVEPRIARIGELQELLYAGGRHRLLVILQGMDTSGKDGTIRRAMRDVTPQGLRVASFKKPTAKELARDFLWRVHAEVPGDGEIVVFNRSHYEDVLVVRVHSLVPRDVWQKRYQQINDFERMLVESGTTILKFFLHISADEQKERLQTRLDDPTKRWKFQHGDLEERKKWNDYAKAYEDAIAKTSTSHAPWYVIPADRKWARDWIVTSILVEKLESLGMKYPEPELGDVTIE